MKDATRERVALQNKKAEKLPVTEEEESKFWEMGLLGCHSAKSLHIITTESYSVFTGVNIEISQWQLVLDIL